MKRKISWLLRSTFVRGTVLLLACFASLATVSAIDMEVSTSGKLYEFEREDHYEFTEAEESVISSSTNTRKKFVVSGDIINTTEKDGIPAYEIGTGNFQFSYVDHEPDETTSTGLPWEIVEDKSKKIDQIQLSDNIMTGAIVVQVSRDRKTWVDVATIVDAFNETAENNSLLYSASNIELINGCFYRVVVAYELRQKTSDGKVLFIETDKYVYKKCAEVYEFYAFVDTAEEDITESDQTYSLGKKTRVADFDTYYGEEDIDKKDAHYGWELGSFYVSGYTAKANGTGEDVVFLKNVGDKVTLWFKLNHDINALNGDEDLSITADTEGQDRYFETPLMDFGKGILIIRHTDHNNVKSDPIIYTNYLEANTMVGAETKVQLFEEGDYEVALDYQVTNNRLVDTTGHYRIFFKFSVRNGNCMAYPFDLATGDELNNSSMTENGFRLDLALSRYLKVNVKREVMKEGADGLVEDTRFNDPAKDGAEYTDEGIYTITVENIYTNQITTKRIYVGTNDILRAHMTSGLSIPEINDLVAQGATIEADGTINVSALNNVETNEPIVEEETVDVETESENPVVMTTSEESEVTQTSDDVTVDTVAKPTTTWIVVVAVVIVVAICGCIIMLKRNKRTKPEHGDTDGGVNE